MKYHANFKAAWTREFEAESDEDAKAKAFTMAQPGTWMTLWRDGATDNDHSTYVDSDEIPKDRPAK